MSSQNEENKNRANEEEKGEFHAINVSVVSKAAYLSPSSQETTQGEETSGRLLRGKTKESFVMEEHTKTSCNVPFAGYRYHPQAERDLPYV